MTHWLLKLAAVELIGIVIIGIIIMHDHRHYHHSLITKVPHTAVALSRAIELIDLLDVEPGNILSKVQKKSDFAKGSPCKEHFTCTVPFIKSG